MSRKEIGSASVQYSSRALLAISAVLARVIQVYWTHRRCRMASPTLNAHRVHLLRTMGWTDAYAARIWRMHKSAIRKARTGVTWRDHPTPPDLTPRTSGGRSAGAEAVPADPVHFRLLDEEGLDPYRYIDKRVPAGALLTLDQVRELPSVIICCGVYFLWRDQELLYVGQSILVGSRLAQHEADGRIPFTHHTCLQVNYDQLDTVEFDYIEHLKPPYNVQIHRPGAPKAPPKQGNGGAERG